MEATQARLGVYVSRVSNAATWPCLPGGWSGLETGKNRWWQLKAESQGCESCVRAPQFQTRIGGQWEEEICLLIQQYASTIPLRPRTSLTFPLLVK